MSAAIRGALVAILCGACRGAQPCASGLPRALERLGVPGLAAGIVKQGRLVCVATAGQADLEQDRPVTDDTLFAWASVSKTVTATALMTLHDEGHFDLDDPIAPHLPFEVGIPACPEEPVTFRHLLAHTSAIVDDPEIYDASYGTGDSPVALGDFLREYLEPGGPLYRQRRNFAERCPGEGYRYSNIGYGLLGHLAEQMTGIPFDQLCQERVFSPLGMDETAWHLADLDPSHVAMPYRGDSLETFEPLGHRGFPTWPDGLLRTSVPQLGRFLAMFIQRGELDGVRVLQASTAEQMRRVQYPEIDETQALAWYYDDFPHGRDVLGHDGADPGTSSLMFFDPEDEVGALLVSNGHWHSERAASALLGDLLEEGRDW